MNVLTFDMDWSPDHAIKYVLDKLDKYEIKSTWFVTHDSKMLERMKNNKNIELGIHPNFHDDSTQGKDVHSILANLKQIIPNAVSIRNHRLYWSSSLIPIFKKYGLKYDSSLILFKSKNLKANSYDGLIRFPIFWEDDIALIEKDFDITLDSKGLKVFNFHPIHIYYNTSSMQEYQNQKQSGFKINNKRKGIRDLFNVVLKNLAKTKTWKMYEIEKYSL